MYKSHQNQFPEKNLLILHGGEANKKWSSVEELLNTFLKKGIERGLPVVAVGGGAHLDLVAFAAAVYQRGLPLIEIPTTLLAMVDAAVGGKNGINFGGYKNLVGTVRQPEKLILDTRFLNSLSSTSWSDGFAEVIKYACIADKKLFLKLLSAKVSYYQQDSEQLHKLIAYCLSHKLSLIKGDEEDRKGQRIFLNFGHSLAHALELTKECSHGAAVACGIAFATWISVERGLLKKKRYKEVCDLLSYYRLPTYLPFETTDVLSALYYDKKRVDNQLQFVCLKKIGRPSLVMLSFLELSTYLDRYQSYF